MELLIGGGIFVIGYTAGAVSMYLIMVYWQ